MTMLDTLQDLIVFFMVLAGIIIGIRVLYVIMYTAFNVGARIRDIASDVLDGLSARMPPPRNRDDQFHDMGEYEIDTIFPEIFTQQNPRQRGRPIPVNPRHGR